MIDTMVRYSLQRRPKGARYSAIEDPAFRSRVVSIASSGASRKHVAALAGCPWTTLVGWVERGLAYPDIEPWGSFSQDYRRAEAGIAGAAADVRAMSIQIMREQIVDYMRWRDAGIGGIPPPLPSVGELVWLDRTTEARFPDQYGASKHRQPEPDLNADHWLEQHALDREQLRALFRDPPPAIDDALLAEADTVYARLLARGFDPSIKKGTK